MDKMGAELERLIDQYLANEIDYRAVHAAGVKAEAIAEHEAGAHDYNESMYADRCPVCRDAGAGDLS